MSESWHGYPHPTAEGTAGPLQMATFPSGREVGVRMFQEPATQSRHHISPGQGFETPSAVASINQSAITFDNYYMLALMGAEMSRTTFTQLSR
jgi:hypothetical protein